MRSLKTKLILLISGLVSIAIISVSVFMYFHTSEEISSATEREAATVTTEVERFLGAYLEQFSLALHRYANDGSIVSFLENDPEENEEWEDIAEDFAYFVELDERADTLYIGAENGEMFTAPVIDLPDDFDPTVRPWYLAASEQTNDVIWTEPYEDAGSGDMVITAAKAVEGSDGVIGVVGVDIYLDELSAMMADIDISYNGYITLLHNDGMAVTHPDDTIQGTHLGEESFVQQMAASDDTSGRVSTHFQGTASTVFYEEVEGIDWTVAAVYSDAEVAAPANELRNLFVVISVAAIGISIVIAYLVGRQIITPILSLRRDVERVMDGDFSAQAKARGKDEVAQLTQGFNQMIRMLQELIGSLELSSRQSSQEAAELSATVQQSTASSEEIAAASTEVAKRAVQQSDDVNSVQAEIENLSVQITKSNELADHMNELMDSVAVMSKDGLSQVGVLREKSSENDKIIQTMNDIVETFTKQTEEVVNVVHMIQGFSEQTNLLALNASIEAARAGEYGKGFAVVAEEVRKLAEQSTEATGTIQKTVGRIQDGGLQVKDEMKKTMELSSEQVAAVNDTDQSFTNIAGYIDQMGNLIQTLAEQLKAMNEARSASIEKVSNISLVSEDTAAAAEEISASTEELVRGLTVLSEASERLNETSAAVQEQVKEIQQ
nr:methyl-accepting chemotaxis protein [Bacillus sp. FJAT-44742]